MKRWPHAPSHLVVGPGCYIVTAATYGKCRLFDTDAKLTLLEDALLDATADGGWALQAWAVMQNHYHFVALASPDSLKLGEMVRKLHARTARALNDHDSVRDRQVWFQYWDSLITHDKSYLARLAYVCTNPVHHGLAPTPEQYRWCSAEWFRQTASASFRESVLSFKTDRVRVVDDF